ncbi:MAG: hypothetical protein ACJ8BW_22540 [Ktedonobacteraceae bacterium]
MNTREKVPMQRLEKSLITFCGLLILSLLIIFAAQPAIYTTTLWPGLVTTERYPLPAILFLGAIVAFVSILMYGVAHHWRWLFWLILVAFTGSVIQIPVEILQLTGVLTNPYPVWYSLFRTGVGVIEIGFAVWMIQIYRQHGIWATGRRKV